MSPVLPLNPVPSRTSFHTSAAAGPSRASGTPPNTVVPRSYSSSRVAPCGCWLWNHQGASDAASGPSKSPLIRLLDLLHLQCRCWNFLIGFPSATRNAFCVCFVGFECHRALWGPSVQGRWTSLCSPRLSEVHVPQAGRRREQHSLSHSLSRVTVHTSG